MTGTFDVKGFVAPGFEQVAETLGAGVTLTLGDRERRADLGEGGGAFCAFADGECVVDVWTGPAGPDGRGWQEDTRAVIMSSTKGMTSLCVHILEDRGELDIDAPVVRYWPEFGQAGKSTTTVRQLLSHQSGAIGVPGADRLLSWDGTGWKESESIAAAIAGADPAWGPGTRHGYHGVTFGWLVGELVRRIAGQSLGTFFEAEVAGPLGVACSIGTPADVLESVATVIDFPVKPGKESALRAIDPESKSGRSVLAGADGSLFADEHGEPRFAAFMNQPVVLAAEIGALGATATARAVARTYAALADGEELVSRGSLERFRTEQVCGRDAVMGVPTRWAVGYSLEPPALVPGAPPMHGPNEGAFGHMGAGGQIGFADPSVRVGVGFVRNHLENQALPLMGACLVDVLYSCLGKGASVYAAEHAKQHPDQPAIIMAPSGRTLTFAEYEDAANQVAHVVRETGLRKGDHMAIFMENHPAMLLAQAGAERTGLYFTPVNSYLSAEEVAYVINDSKSRTVVTSTAKADVAAELPALCSDVDRWIMVDTTSGDGGVGGVGARASDPFESWGDTVGAQPTDHVPDEKMGAPMMYSSGTTGRPKGILRPMYDLHPSETSIAVLGIAALWRCREGMVYLSPAPLYHTAPQVSVAIALRTKSTAVVMEHFDPALYLELVGRYGVTHSQVVPTMFSRMLKLPDEVRATADLSTLEVIIHAAAPCPVPVKEQMIEWFGPILLEYYAATEGNGCTFITSEDWLAHKGSVGRSVLSDIHILDDDGRPCPVGTSGTVWFAGATDFEYFNDPEKTASTRRDDGRTSTVGDVGYLDPDGYLFLTDRKAHMIISGGVNIYPQETENLLVTHPSVLDAAVIGVPNEDLGEEVKAVVQLVDGVDGVAALETALIAFCREHLAHFKCPRSVDFVDELPRLPTGKLYKGVLREQYWASHDTRIV